MKEENEGAETREGGIASIVGAGGRKRFVDIGLRQPSSTAP